jgi:uncharacterized protein DUF2784
MLSEARQPGGWYEHTRRSEPLRNVDRSPHPTRPGNRGKLIGSMVESMAYRVLADLVMVAHLGCLVFVAIGGLLSWRWRRLIWTHLVAMTVAVVSITIGFDCPLTNLEKSLRRLAGDHPYAGGFIDHYIVGTLYPRGHNGLARGAVAVVVVAVYGSVIVHRSRARSNANQMS